MITNLLKKYFALIFIISTFIGVFHHHDDLLEHSDCKVCTIQSSIADGDTPVKVSYLSAIETPKDKIQRALVTLHVSRQKSTNYARAPPLVS